MIQRYIFISKKNNSDEQLSIEFLTKFIECISVTSTNFVYLSSGQRYTIKYSIQQYPNKNTYILSLQNDLSDEKSILALNDLNQAITSTVHVRKAWYLIRSFDGISQYYCSLAYPQISQFERKIRDMLFILLTSSLGVEWEKTITDSLKNSIKKNFQGSHKDRLIEEALYGLTLDELKEYVFTPHKFETTNQPPDIDELSNISHDTLVKMMADMYEISLWEKYIHPKLEIDNFSDDIDNVRYYRNIVAHSKIMNKDDYDKCVELIAPLLTKLDKCIQTLITSQYSEETKADIIKEFSNISITASTVKMFESYKSTLSLLDENARKNYSEILATIPTLNSQLNLYDILKRYGEMFSQLQSKGVDINSAFQLKPLDLSILSNSIAQRDKK